MIGAPEVPLPPLPCECHGGHCDEGLGLDAFVGIGSQGEHPEIDAVVGASPRVAWLGGPARPWVHVSINIQSRSQAAGHRGAGGQIEGVFDGTIKADPKDQIPAIHDAVDLCDLGSGPLPDGSIHPA